MLEKMIMLETIDSVRKFSEIASSKDYKIELESDKYIVNAKSSMGIFSLDLSKELKLVIRSDDEFEVDRIKNKIKRFIV